MCEKRGKIFRRKFHRSKKNRCPRIREKGGRRLHTKESWGNFLVEFDVKIVERFTTRPPTLLRFVPFFLLSSTAVPLRLVGTSLAKHVINPPREGGCISFPSFLSIKISAVVERKVIEIELLSIEQRRWSIFSKIKVECRVETRWAMIIRREYKNERGQRRRRINIYSKYT